MDNLITHSFSGETNKNVYLQCVHTKDDKFFNKNKNTNINALPVKTSLIW